MERNKSVTRCRARPISRLRSSLSLTCMPHENLIKGKRWTKRVSMFGRGEQAPTPTLSILLRKRLVLLSSDFVLTKDPPPLYYKNPPCLFYHKNCPSSGHFGSFVRTKSALSKTGRFLNKTESVGGGGLLPSSNMLGYRKGRCNFLPEDPFPSGWSQDAWKSNYWLSAPSHILQIASDATSRSPNCQSFPQLVERYGSNLKLRIRIARLVIWTSVQSAVTITTPFSARQVTTWLTTKSANDCYLNCGSQSQSNRAILGAKTIGHKYGGSLCP